jgi:ribosome biogenesis protein Nip4
LFDLEISKGRKEEKRRKKRRKLKEKETKLIKRENRSKPNHFVA